MSRPVDYARKNKVLGDACAMTVPIQWNRSMGEGSEAVRKLGTIECASCRRRTEQGYAPEVVVSRYVDVYERAEAALAARR